MVIIMKKLNFIFLTLTIIITANAHAAVQYPEFGPLPKANFSGIGDFAENINKGYQMGRQAAMMRQQQRALELQNKIMEEQLKALKRSHR